MPPRRSQKLGNRSIVHPRSCCNFTTLCYEKNEFKHTGTNEFYKALARDVSGMGGRGTSASQKSAAVPRRARVQGSWTFVSLNSRLESKEKNLSRLVSREVGSARRNLLLELCRYLGYGSMPLGLENSVNQWRLCIVGAIEAIGTIGALELSCSFYTLEELYDQQLYVGGVISRIITCWRCYIQNNHTLEVSYNGNSI